MYFFRERIENAFMSRDYYEQLDHLFTFEQAMQFSVAVKGANVTRNSVQQMLKNWRKQGLAEKTEDGKFRKNK